MSEKYVLCSMIISSIKEIWMPCCYYHVTYQHHLTVIHKSPSVASWDKTVPIKYAFQNLIGSSICVLFAYYFFNIMNLVILLFQCTVNHILYREVLHFGCILTFTCPTKVFHICH